MSNDADRVLAEISRVWPDWISNSQIESRTGVKPHQQVFQITRSLTERGLIKSEQRGREWFFQERRDHAGHAVGTPEAQSEEMRMEPDPSVSSACRIFEGNARQVMNAHYQTSLYERSLPGVPKRFDFVSADGSVVGDAKYFDLVRGTKTPPAKYSIIAEHVWLLERTNARHKFLVFGNNRLVPEQWLRKYGQLAVDVEFWFLGDGGVLERLATSA